jgi:hypothetical protein
MRVASSHSTVTLWLAISRFSLASESAIDLDTRQVTGASTKAIGGGPVPWSDLQDLGT